MKIKSKHNEGSHLTIDGFGADKSLLNDKKVVLSILQELPDHLGMTSISEPVVVEHDAKDPKESGITGMVIIAESHISVHTYPEKKYFAMDVFSCKEFDIEKAVEYLRKKFNPSSVKKNVIRRGHSETFDEDNADIVKGVDVSKIKTTKGLVGQMANIGLQATNLAKSVEIIRNMKKDNATVFLTFTSNMVSSGMRELFAYLCEKKFVDIIITGVGSIEEDLIKTQNNFLLGDFHMDDLELHRKGINRIGNVLVPNDRYEMLEDELVPFFDKMNAKQEKTGKLISPSNIIHELGKTIDDKKSILYWCSKNNIPIFCPAITDGAFGLQLFFYKQKHPEFGIDSTGDMKKLANLTLNAEKTGGIMLGGGFAKHHAIGVNILREGFDYAVYVSTATQYDGSLSGARTSEAISWSKIKEDANSMFVEGDASIIFPLMAGALDIK